MMYQYPPTPLPDVAMFHYYKLLLVLKPTTLLYTTFSVNSMMSAAAIMFAASRARVVMSITIYYAAAFLCVFGDFFTALPLWAFRQFCNAVAKSVSFSLLLFCSMSLLFAKYKSRKMRIILAI